jgi:hypothetical protein
MVGLHDAGWAGELELVDLQRREITRLIEIGSSGPG